MKNELVNMDCLEWLKSLEAGSVDMLLSDPPYGTTHCHWDMPLPWDDVWKEVRRVVKPSGAILLFSAQPFTTDLINSNRKMFRYEIIWEKTQKTGFMNARKMPMRAHENILVFYQKLPTYNPQKYSVERKDMGRTRLWQGDRAQQYGHYDGGSWTETGERYPTDVIKFSSWNGALFGKTDNATQHPTQKPIDLLEYLIRTYTDEGDVVADMCAGSNSTGIACYNTKRNYTGCEKDVDIFNDAVERTRVHMSQLSLFQL